MTAPEAPPMGMVEIVARALCDDDNETWHEMRSVYMRKARVALAPLRKPTFEMVKAMMGEDAADYKATRKGRERLGTALVAFRAAIDTALVGK